MSERKLYSGGFRGQILRSVKLSTVQFISQVGLRLVSTVVLTRLLSPEIYGTFAVVLVYRYILEMISDFGVRSVILTKEGDLDTPFLRTCWTVSIIRGFVIAFFSCMVALIIFWLQESGLFQADSAYAAASLPWAIAALGGISFIQGFKTTNHYAYEREMKFGHVTLGIVISSIFGLISTILLALWLRSIWALVIGAAIQTSFLLIYSFLAFKGPAMRVGFDRDSLKIIIARGKWIMAHSSLTALSQSGDRLILGVFMSSSMFGFYFIARQILDIGSGFLKNIHAQIGLQIFKKISQNPEDFREKYYRYRIFFDTIAGLGAGFLFIFAPRLIEIMYDNRYMPISDLIQPLTFSLLFIGAVILREAFSAERKFREMTLLSLTSTITLWIGLLAMVWFDEIKGAILVVAVHRLPEVVILWWLASRRSWLIPWRETLVIGFFGLGALFGFLILKLERFFT